MKNSLIVFFALMTITVTTQDFAAKRSIMALALCFAKISVYAPLHTPNMEKNLY